MQRGAERFKGHRSRKTGCSHSQGTIMESARTTTRTVPKGAQGWGDGSYVRISSPGPYIHLVPRSSTSWRPLPRWPPSPPHAGSLKVAPCPLHHTKVHSYLCPALPSLKLFSLRALTLANPRREKGTDLQQVFSHWDVTNTHTFK